MSRIDPVFNVWPWFWLCVFVWIAAAITRPPGFTPFTVVAGLGMLSALVLLIIGITNAIRRRRSK